MRISLILGSPRDSAQPQTHPCWRIWALDGAESGGTRSAWAAGTHLDVGGRDAHGAASCPHGDTGQAPGKEEAQDHGQPRVEGAGWAPGHPRR